MNKVSLILLMALATGAAYAQSAGGGITMSTDPAKAAAVEKHAQELRARQSKEASSKSTATHPSTKKTKAKTAPTHKSPTKHKSSDTKPATATKG